MSDPADFFVGILIAIFSVFALICVASFIGSIVGAFGVIAGAAWGAAVASECFIAFCGTGLALAIFFIFFS